MTAARPAVGWPWPFHMACRRGGRWASARPCECRRPARSLQNRGSPRGCSRTSKWNRRTLRSIQRGSFGTFAGPGIGATMGSHVDGHFEEAEVRVRIVSLEPEPQRAVGKFGELVRHIFEEGRPEPASSPTVPPAMSCSTMLRWRGMKASACGRSKVSMAHRARSRRNERQK